MTRGLAGEDLGTLRLRVLGAWDAFIDLAARADLGAPSRLPGWSGRDVCVHLGAWPGRSALAELLASARSGGRGPVRSADEVNARLLAAHGAAGPDEVLAAVREAREAVARFLAGPEAAELATADTASALGPLPLLGVLNAAGYELAVHALDLTPCGAPAPPAALLDAGVAALVDVTGALAARVGLATTLTVLTPDHGWSTTSDGAGWQTRAVTGPGAGVLIRGSAADVLDVSAGRANGPLLLARRRIRVRDLAGLLALSAIVEQVPGLPGGPALRLASRALSGAGSFLGRLPQR